MTVSKKIKTIDNKVKQNKTQYDLDRQTPKISALSSGKLSKYKFLTGKGVLPVKDLIEQVTAMKRFKYSPLGKELKAQTLKKKQYQKLDYTFEFNKIIKNDKPTLKNYSESDLIYESNYAFTNIFMILKNLITFL